MIDAMTVNSVERPPSGPTRKEDEETDSGHQEMTGVIYGTHTGDDYDDHNPPLLDGGSELEYDLPGQGIDAAAQANVDARSVQRDVAPKLVARNERPDGRMDTGFKFGPNTKTRFTPLAKASAKEQHLIEGDPQQALHDATNSHASTGPADTPKETIKTLTETHMPDVRPVATSDENETRRQDRTGKSVAFSSVGTLRGSNKKPFNAPGTSMRPATPPYHALVVADDSPRHIHGPGQHGRAEQDNSSPEQELPETSAQTTPAPQKIQSVTALAEHREVSELREVVPSDQQTQKRNRNATLQQRLVSTNSKGDKGTPSKENLFALILYRMQEEEKAHAAEKAAMEAQSLETDEVKEAHARLVVQFNALRDQEQAQAAELLEHKRSLQAIREKFKRVVDYMNGLTNDHNSLKSKAVELTRSAKEAQQERTAVQEALDDTITSLQKSEAARKASLSSAKAMVTNLEEKIQQQQAQISEREEQIKIERDRNDRLSAELSKLSETYREVLTAIEGSGAALEEKFKDLPSTETLRSLLESASDQGELKSLIETTMTLVEEVNSKETLGISDLQFLHSFAQGHDARLVNPSSPARNR